MALLRMLPLTLILLASILLAREASTQTDMMRVTYLSSANQTGVLAYCKAKGWAEQGALDAQRTVVGRLPATADRSGLAEAEATGRKGELLSNGTPLSVAAMAQKTNTTEQDLCGRLAASAKTAAAQSLVMPTYPAMPGAPMPGAPRQP